jgi:lipopolysaccharide transport system ATP-binding protein
MGNLAIRTQRLSKRYRIGAKQQRYQTLRDNLANAVAGSARRVGALLWRRNGAARRLDENTVWALKDVDFEIAHGEVVGVIGRNGAGKSTLLKILSRITEPTEGHAEVYGRIGSLLEVGTGFHNELTGRENIYLNGAILGMRRAEISRKFDEIVAFAEVEKFIDTPVKHYSSGMYLRLAFAVAAHLEPEILLVDEVLAVGDAAFQKKCLGKMGGAARQGRTVLFVSHNMGAVRSLCRKGIVLDGGRIVAAGDIDQSIEAYYRLIGALQGARDDVPMRRPGSGPAFGPLRLGEGDGNTIAQSQEFEISADLHLDRAVSGFTLFLFLDDMQGRRICQLREESTTLGLKDLVPGTYPIRAKFPPLWLNPGLYSVECLVGVWGAYAGARAASDKFPLDVVGESGSGEAVLRPQVEWSIDNP